MCTVEWSWHEIVRSDCFSFPQRLLTRLLTPQEISDRCPGKRYRKLTWCLHRADGQEMPALYVHQCNRTGLFKWEECLSMVVSRQMCLGLTLTVLVRL